MTATALVGALVFDGEALLEGRAVIVEAGRIVGLVRDADVPAGTEQKKIAGILAPGFIDTQVNGGGGVLFNDTPTVEGITTIGAAHRRYGTTGFLPTLITDTRDLMATAISATEEAIAAGVPGVLGVHLEGPFINPERKGAHDPRYIRAVDDADLALLTASRKGRTLVTIAPEVVPVEAIARLAAGGCLVSAGHTLATYEQVALARSAGLTAFTHLYNAMPPLAGRAPGPIGLALEDAGTRFGLIVDLIHVAAPAIRIAAAAGHDRTMLVTDAMPSVGSDVPFTLNGRIVNRIDGRLTLPDGTLAGSDLDMAGAVRNCVHAIGLPIEAALRMASRNPAEFLGLGRELGYISPGFRANLVLLDDDLRATATWIDGVEEAA